MSYDEYFNDYYAEACKVMISEAAKDGVFKDGYYLKEHLQIPIVHQVLSTDAGQEKIVEFIGSFMDKHYKELSAVGPVYRFSFGSSEVKFFYDLFNTSDEELLKMFNEMVEDTYYGKISKFMKGWVDNAPHKLLFCAMLVDSIQNGYDDMLECCSYLWGFCEYPMVHAEFWPVAVQPDVMTYTMEHLGPKFRFTQKGMKTLKELLKYHGDVSISCEKEKLRTGADNTYMDFMYRMRNQIKNSFRNLSKVYYDNVKAGRTSHTNVTTFDDGNIAEQEGHISNIATIVDKTVDKFISNGLNSSIVKVAADANKVDKSNLSGYINSIWAVKENKMYRLVEDIITQYFNANPTNSGVGGKEFIIFARKLFRSLTSNDKINQELRSILDYWMYEIIDIRKTYSREATITSYTRAIWDYIILLIANYN